MMDVANYSPSLLSVSKLNNSGHNTEITQLENRKLLIRLIRRAGETSRKELAHQSGLKQATVTIIMNDFIKRGLVEETGLLENGNGRRMRGLRIVNRYCVISVRLSISYLSVAAYDMNGDNLYCHKIFRDTLSKPEETCDLLEQEIRSIENSCLSPEMQVLGIGIGVEGTFVIKNQRYQYYNVEKKDYFDFAAEINKRVSYPVFINRMSNYTAYYIWKKNWKDELGVIVAFTLSYTVECGIIVNGEMLNGSQGMAGRIGQLVCGYEDDRPLYFKDEVSVDRLLKNTKQLLPEYPDSILWKCKDNLNIRDVIAAYKKKDTLAMKVYDSCAVYCGRAINSIINMLNPNVVFFGDEVPLEDEYFEKVYQEAIKGIYTYFDRMEFRQHSDGTGYWVKVPESDLSLKLLKPDITRSTMNDPSLRGAAEYVIEASIENGVFFKELEDISVTH